MAADGWSYADYAPIDGEPFTRADYYREIGRWPEHLKPRAMQSEALQAPPRDFHDVLVLLAPLGWQHCRHRPGLHLPEGMGGPSWIRPDGVGFAMAYGGAVRFDRVPLAEVPEMVRRRMGK